MGEEKKIKIRVDRKDYRNPSGPSNAAPYQGNAGAKTFKNLDLLEQTVKKIENKYKNFGFYDSKEEEFFEKNQGKPVTLELVNEKKLRECFRVWINSGFAS